MRKRGGSGRKKAGSYWKSRDPAFINMATVSAVSVFYLLVFFTYSFSLYYDWEFVTIGHSHYAGKFKYLTFWNLVLQTVYFGLCVLNVFSGSDIPASQNPKLRCGVQKLRDTVHSTLAFPVGMFVVTTFWSLYALDRELVYPKALDAIIPAWLNHVMHTTVLPLLLIEKSLVYHHHPKRHNGIFIMSAFALSYLIWILWIAHAAGIWVYPVLEVMQTQERVIFISFLLFLFISIYLLGESLTKFLWRKERSKFLAATKKLK